MATFKQVHRRASMWFGGMSPLVAVAGVSGIAVVVWLISVSSWFFLATLALCSATCVAYGAIRISQGGLSAHVREDILPAAVGVLFAWPIGAFGMTFGGFTAPWSTASAVTAFVVAGLVFTFGRLLLRGSRRSS